MSACILCQSRSRFVPDLLLVVGYSTKSFLPGETTAPCALNIVSKLCRSSMHISRLRRALLQTFSGLGAYVATQISHPSLVVEFNALKLDTGYRSDNMRDPETDRSLNKISKQTDDPGRSMVDSKVLSAQNKNLHVVTY